MRKIKRSVPKKSVKKRYVRKNGFAFVPLLLVLVCLVLAGSGIYYLMNKSTPVGQSQSKANSIEKTSESEIAGVPKSVNDFLDQSDFEKIRAKGGTIYTGTTPPNITGEYLLNSLRITYDPGTFSGAYPIGFQLPSYIYGFSNQKADGSTRAYYRSDDVEDTAEGVGAFISGQNNCFSVFINQVGDTNECHYSSPQIISACLTPEGIKNFTNSYFPKEKEGSGCEELAPIGYLRIAEESDKIAEKQ